MTCGVAGFAVTVPVEDGPFDPVDWGLASLDFPPGGGTETVSVGRGLRGAPGAGSISVIVEPAEEEVTARPAGHASVGLEWLTAFIPPGG